ncbi:MAG: HAMP domain-containing histidine kinase [Deltaproteobacteria bacterium]|nr:HAMP domain-containing histidine kinase [Deltaproteobacteria bacterium]
MSIRLRLTALLTLLGLALFVGYALIAYRGEERDLRTSTEREVRTLGRALEIALGNALRDRQRMDIDETLAALDAIRPAVEVHVHDAEGATIALSENAIVDRQIEAMVSAAGTSGTATLVTDPDHSRIIYAAPLVGDDGAALGAFALVRPLDDLDADLARTKWRLVLTMAAFVIATMFAGVLLGTLYVKRPVARVLEGIRHVRQGDTDARVPSTRKDEIGALVDEFNAMVVALDVARQRVEQEVEARLRLERGLRDVDKMVTIAQLSAGLAHEIGSPLQVLSGRGQALVERSADPEARRLAEIVVAQTERITKIVEQLLSFGRRRAPQIARCDLAQPIRAVLDLLEREVRRGGVTLRFEPDGGDHMIDGDADQLQQVTLNLVKNALAATPRGGVVTVRVARQDDRVQLIVEDNGSGIAPEIQARLFEPFFTTRSAEGGTGLGLAVVRAIVLEHGGAIDVHSTPGQGATFTITFPGRLAERAA